MHPQPNAQPSALDERVRRLGFASYDAYLSSPHWQRIKRLYYNDPNTTKACLCGEVEGLALHHKTYVRLGSERVGDLQALCRPCHSDVHVLARRGLMKLTLEDYTSEERAAAYAAVREARETMPDERAAQLEALRSEVKAALRHLRNTRTVQVSRTEDTTVNRRRQRLATAASHATGATASADELQVIATVVHAVRVGDLEPDAAAEAVQRIQAAQEFRRTAGLYSDVA